MFFSLLSLVYSEVKHIDLHQFFPGQWNMTGGFLDLTGEFTSDDYFINFTIDVDPEDNNTFFGKIPEFPDSSSFDIRIIIDRFNDQIFTIQKTYFPKTFTMAHVELIYGPRNMPHASGQWINSTQHYKLSILSLITFELHVFRPENQIVNIYRFVKKVQPKPPSVTSILKSICFVFFFYIAFKLASAREIIHNTESNKNQQQTPTPDKKND